MYSIGGLKTSVVLLKWGIGLLVGLLALMFNHSSARFDRLDDRNQEILAKVYEINQESSRQETDISALKAERLARTPEESTRR